MFNTILWDALAGLPKVFVFLVLFLPCFLLFLEVLFIIGNR